MNDHSHAPRRPRALPTGARYLGPHDPDQQLDVTVVLRRRGARPAPAAWPQRPAYRREDYGEHCGAAPEDIDSLRRFARAHELDETACHPQRRTLHLRGSAGALQRAFDVELGHYQLGDGGEHFVGCTQTPTLPAEAIAVLGLDRRPVARPHFRKPRAQPSTSYTPVQLGQLYAFPSGADGSGQTVAIIELGGGYSTSDLSAYFRELGIPQPSVTAVSVDGGQNQTGSDADGEVMLDIEVVGALAPGAKIAVYFAPNTDQGFYDAISQAAHATDTQPSVISISWGGPEDSWSAQALQAMESALEDAASLGITVTAAAGDSGSDDGETDGQPHVDYPASSAYALACGGTKLQASGNAIISETVWNEDSADEGATGGGVSTSFPLPAWQQGIQVPAAPGGGSGRGVPDVAGDADPLTGYRIRLDGQDQVIGGTSAVAPLWAALVARLNQQLGNPLGDPHQAFYRVGGTAFRDVTTGDNGDYQAGPGWDACTGWGSPNGQALLDALKSLAQGGGNA